MSEKKGSPFIPACKFVVRVTDHFLFWGIGDECFAYQSCN